MIFITKAIHFTHSEQMVSGIANFLLNSRYSTHNKKNGIGVHYSYRILHFYCLNRFFLLVSRCIYFFIRFWFVCDIYRILIFHLSFIVSSSVSFVIITGFITRLSCCLFANSWVLYVIRHGVVFTTIIYIQHTHIRIQRYIALDFFLSLCRSDNNIHCITYFPVFFFVFFVYLLLTLRFRLFIQYNSLSLFFFVVCYM